MFKRLKKPLSFLLVFALVISATLYYRPAQEASAAWYSTSWDYRVAITIDATQVDATLTDFPVYVDLSDLPANFHSEVNQTDARDIRVTKSDGTTEVPREVVFYTSGTDTGELHFKADSISSSTDTVFYIYYGNASATEPAVTATYGRNNVWTTYDAVFHLEEAANTTAGGYADSTGNGNDGQGVGDIADTAGQLAGNAMLGDTDGTENEVRTGLTTAYTDFSASVWFKDDGNVSSWERIVDKRYNQGFYIGRNNNSNNFSWGIRTTSSGTFATITDTDWHYVMITRSGTQGQAYYDGTNPNSPTVSGVALSTTDLEIGGNTDGAADKWSGSIDEVRITSTVLPQAWADAEYTNQNTPETFYTVGTADVTAPTVSTLSPADNATGVAVDANLVITFDEAVDAEAGASNDITIKETVGDATVETIDAQDAKVTGTGTTTITINPAATLDGSTEYYVQIGADAFDDAAGNSYAGISSTTAWSFTTVDTTNPTVSTLSPADDATDVALDANLVITFDEAVDVESGNITLYEFDDTLVEAIDVTGGQVTGTGTTTITINPTSDLDYSTAYYVQIAATAFDDAASNSYAGIADETTWSFTAEDAPDVTDPTVSTLSPADNSVDASTSTNLVITFDEAVDVETGNIVIYESDDSTFETIPVGDAKVTGTGTTTITINPAGTLAAATSYYVQIAATAFDDAAGNSYAGIADKITWNFSTASGSGGAAGSVGGFTNISGVSSISF